MDLDSRSSNIDDDLEPTPSNASSMSSKKRMRGSMPGRWTYPYYSCQDKSWLVSYVAPFKSSTSSSANSSSQKKVKNNKRKAKYVRSRANCLITVY